MTYADVDSTERTAAGNLNFYNTTLGLVREVDTAPNPDVVTNYPRSFMSV